MSERSRTAKGERVTPAMIVAIEAPLHLALLISLEERARSVDELAEKLQADRPQVERAIGKLYDSGLIHEPEQGRFTTTNLGWTEVVEKLGVLERDGRKA
jgi:predicted transcriptional regulator